VASNQRLFASKLRFLTGLTSSPVADSNLQEFVDAFTLPAADGDSDQVLKTDGEGLITFGSASSGGTDSATVLGLVDSAHVQLRQDYAYGSLTGVPNVLDSADVSLIAGSSAGVDSAYVTTQIDALIDGAPGALNTLNELAAAINDDSQAYNTLLSLVNTKIDSADAITLITTTVDSAYVQLSAIGLPYSSLTGAPTLLDSALAQSLIDATAQTQDIADIVGAEGNSGEFLKSLGGGNATWVNISTVVDSAYVHALLIGAPTILDSADVLLIAGDAGTDSATVLGLIDSAHVQLRQDYAYASLTGAPTTLDSALAQSLIDATAQVLDITDIVGSSGTSGEFLKSLGGGNAEWINISTVVDSAYVHALLIGAPNILDSADVSLIAGDAGTDSATVLGLIDSAHVQLRQDYAYGSLTGAPTTLDSALSQSLIDATVQVLDIADIVGSSGNSGQYLKSLGSGNAEWASVLDSADVSSIAGSLSGLDAAGVSALVDSDYVQLRQDYAYGSLTGTPTTLDSALTTQLIDSAYVQLSAIGLPYSSLTATPNILDSALTTQLIDSAYVQLRSGGGGGLSAWVEKTDAYTLVAGDRIVLDTRDSALSLTLPASPTFSDEVSIIDGTNYAATNNVTISGNGKKILASDSDFVINIDRASIDLMFYNDSQGWILTKAI